MDPGVTVMNVRVDQTRDDELAAGLNDVGVARSYDFPLLANLADAISFDENRGSRRRWSSGSVNQSPAFNDNDCSGGVGCLPADG